MRHRKHTAKLGKTSSHKRCMMANMLKSLILTGRIETTLPKAKELRRYADRMITLAKKNTLASKRQAIGKMMIRFNPLTAKEARATKDGETKYMNGDRQVIKKLFNELGPRFQDRPGGYTRIMKTSNFRKGDDAQKVLIEYVE